MTDTARPFVTEMPASGFWSMMFPSGTDSLAFGVCWPRVRPAALTSLVALPTVSPVTSGTDTCEPPEPSNADRAISAAMTKIARTATPSSA